MDKEKIEKLLKSTNLGDVLLAIQLSYKLPLEDFMEIFPHKEEIDRYLNLNKYGPLWYRFTRAGKDYSFGCIGLGKLPNDHYGVKGWIDITPENYTENISTNISNP